MRSTFCTEKVILASMLKTKIILAKAKQVSVCFFSIGIRPDKKESNSFDLLKYLKHNLQKILKTTNICFILIS